MTRKIRQKSSDTSGGVNQAIVQKPDPSDRQKENIRLRAERVHNSVRKAQEEIARIIRDEQRALKAIFDELNEEQKAAFRSIAFPSETGKLDRLVGRPSLNLIMRHTYLGDLQN